MGYRVCIPCAGIGSRLGGLTKFLNKSLVSIANRPTLSHLIERFPLDVEFVIALGYKGHLIREFLTLAYPERQFYFSEVLPFEGPGSGLGHSIQSCKQYLQQPFIFISCDTLVDEIIPPPDKNWMGYARSPNLGSYRTLGICAGLVNSIAEKGEFLPDHEAYIGLAGINDYHEFWEAMEQDRKKAVETGEVHGMRSLLSKGIQAYQFTWHDTGSPESLAETRRYFRQFDDPNVLEKANEAIWFVGDTVIKFCEDKKFIANRVERSKEIQGFVPKVNKSESHMYSYSKVQGKVMSEVVTLPIFETLLKHCNTFWLKKELKPDEIVRFQDTCMTFYRDKTFERVELFYKNFDQRDGVELINGKPMPKLESLLESLDWEYLAKGLAGRFHGDFHFENILWNESDQKFIFLDWRQDFGGDLTVGDIYYDLAKLLHGLIISHELIVGNFYKVDWRSEAVQYDFHRKQILVECERYFDFWLKSRGFDHKKVRILTSLIFLNIAALHHYPYSLLLYSLGKSMLKIELDE